MVRLINKHCSSLLIDISLLTALFYVATYLRRMAKFFLINGIILAVYLGWLSFVFMPVNVCLVLISWAVKSCMLAWLPATNTTDALPFNSN